jgi:hypothetical protein
MNQIIGDNNQTSELDPETAYFIEKFGHIMKNMNRGFSGHIQEALIQRIFFTVDQFRNDLPDFVKELEKQRLINNAKKVLARNAQKEVSVPKYEEFEKKSPKTDFWHRKKNEIIITEIDLDLDESQLKIIENLSRKDRTRHTDSLNEAESDIQIGEKSKLPRPSAAIALEEKRLKEQENISMDEEAKKPTKGKSDSKKEKDMTVWERAWHKYGGSPDDAINNLK